MSEQRSTEGAPSDLDLITAVREGDPRAFGVLWQRHHAAVLAAIRSFTGFDPEDIAQETFLRILKRLQSGSGPDTAFRAYAIATARNVAITLSRARASTEVTGVSNEVWEQGDTAPESNPETQVIGSQFTLDVFTSLHPRWQEALWYRDVEDLPVPEISTLLGLTENSTSALLKRAREGFKQAWLAAHLRPSGQADPECDWLVGKLPQYYRGKSPSRVHRRVSAHLASCASCAVVAEQNARTGAQLALALLPPLIGGAGTAGYLAWTAETAGKTAASAAAGAGAAGISAGSLGSGAGTAGSAGTVGVTGAALAHGATLPAAVTAIGAVGLMASALVFGGAAPEPPQVPAPSKDTATQGSEPQDSSPPPEASHHAAASQDPAHPADTAEDPASSSGTGTAPALAASTSPVAVSPAEPSGDPVAPSPHPDPLPWLPPGPKPSEPTGEIPVQHTDLTAVARDGVESGVFPVLLGRGVPGAEVTLTLTNGSGDIATAFVPVAADGSWTYTVTELDGTLQVSGTQRYRTGSGETRDPVRVLGSFVVGTGLPLIVTSPTPQSSRAVIQWDGPITRNAVVTITSSTLGPLVSHAPLSATGETTFEFPTPATDLGTLTWWQGETSVGPRRTLELSESTL